MIAGPICPALTVVRFRLAAATLALLIAGAVSLHATSMVRVSDNGRYLIDSQGKPFLWQGDTEWELTHFLTADDAAALLHARKHQGFTVIQVMATGVFPEWNLQQKVRAPADLRAWLDGDPLTPDEVFFARMDRIVAAAEKEGLLLVIGVYHAKDVEAGRVTLANVGPWSRWLAARYKKASNIAWSMYPHAEHASFAMIRESVRGLQEGDGGAHLITMHPDPSPTSSSFMHGEPWLSFNTYQTWTSDRRNFTMGEADYARTPAKPVVDGEARYEAEDGTTALEVRRGAWWAWMAGGFYSYGHRDDWKSPRTWREWVDSPGARSMKVLGDVMRGRRWWRLVPDQSLLPKPGENAACRSSDGDWELVYVPDATAGAVAVRLSGVTTNKKVRVAWLDPRDGATVNVGEFPSTATPAVEPPKGWEDAVLSVEPLR
jgi:hypothetical protein